MLGKSVTWRDSIDSEKDNSELSHTAVRMHMPGIYFTNN